MLTEKFNWTKFNMVRVYLVAQDKGNCENLIRELPKQEIDPILKEFRDSLEGNLSEDNRKISSLIETLDQYNKDSLGGHLFQFYLDSQFPKIGKEGAFPARYIVLHDAHHLLINSGTDEQGELETIAFEGGLTGSNKADSILPVFAQVAAFSQMSGINFPRIARAWEIGANAEDGLLENWDISIDLPSNLNDIRKKYNITPLTLNA